MKKLLKILVWCAATGAVLLIGAAIAIRVFFPPEKLKAMTMTFLTKQFKREFRIDSVNAGLGGVTVKDFAVSENGGFAKGSMLEAKAIGVNFHLAALLHKEILVSSVDFDGINLHVEKYKDGSFNFSDLLSPAATAPAGSAATPAAQVQKPAYTFEVDRLALNNASVSYKDETGAQMQISKLAFAAKDITLKHPFDVSGEFDLIYPFMGHQLPLHLKAAATVDATAPAPADYKATIKNFSAGWDKLTLSASGEIKNFAAPQGTMQCQVSQFSTTQLATLFPQLPQHLIIPQTNASASFKMDTGALTLSAIKAQTGPASAAGTFKMGFGKTMTWLFNGEAKASLPEIDTTALAKLSASIPRGYHIPAADMAAKFVVTQDKAEVSDWQLKAASLSAKGSVTASKAKDGWQALALISYFNFSLSDAAKIAPDYAKYAPSGIASGQVKVVYAPKANLEYGGSIALSRLGVTYEKTVLSDLNATVQLAGTSAKMQKFSGKLNGADFNGFASLSMDPKLIKTQATIAFSALDLGALMPPATAAGAAQQPKKSSAKTTSSLPPVDVQITITAAKVTHPNFTGQNVELKCDLTSVTPEMDKLSGKASFAIKNGQFKDLGSFAQNNKFVKILFLPLVQMQKAVGGVKLSFLPDLNNISYTLIDGGYTFKNGQMTIEKSDLDSNVAQVWATGTVNLPAQDGDIKVKIKPAGDLGKYGQPVIMVKGNLMSPSVKLDAKSLVTDEVKQKAIDAGKKLLQGLFK